MPAIIPPPPDRHENGFNVRQIFQNLQAHRALTGDDFLVIVGRHDYVCVLCRKFFGFELSFGCCRGRQDDVRS